MKKAIPLILAAFALGVLARDVVIPKAAADVDLESRRNVERIVQAIEGNSKATKEAIEGNSRRNAEAIEGNSQRSVERLVSAIEGNSRATREAIVNAVREAGRACSK